MSQDSGLFYKEPRTRKVLDPVHGFIEFDQFYWNIIDTEQFQRLRSVKQLGTTFLVFPGATHSRFEHSVGTGHLAQQYVHYLHRNCPETVAS